MMKIQSIICIFFIITLLLLSIHNSSSSGVSIYDALQSHDLPSGLFPTGITNFTFDPDTGSFQARLNQSCHANFKSQETDVHYNWNVSGFIRQREILNMSGVSAQDLFLWFPVKSIRVDFPSSGLVHFDVGVVRKQFSLSLFEVPPVCEAAEDPQNQVHLLASLPAQTSFLLYQKQVETVANEGHGSDLWSAS